MEELDLYDKIFNQSKKDKKLLYFEKYNDNISFCGYVLSYNSQIVQIQHFTRYGKKDGVINIRFSDINYIVTESEYLNSIQYIIDNNKLLDAERDSSLPMNPSNDWIIQILREYQNDKSVILGIEASGSWYIGFVNEIDDQFFSFSEIDKNGVVLDYSIFKLSDITSVHINEIEGRKRLLLYNWRESQKNNTTK